MDCYFLQCIFPTFLNCF